MGNFAKFCHLSTKNATIGCDDRFLSTDMVITNQKLEEIKIVYLHFLLFLLKLELCIGSFCSYLSAIVFLKNA